MENIKKAFKFGLLLLIFWSCDRGENPSNTSEELEATNYTLQPGQRLLTINQMIDGETVARSVHIVAPDIIDRERNYPVLFAFHGAGGDGGQFLNNPLLNNLISADEFIGIYPNGHNTFWNLGSENTTADDVAFVDMIVAKLENYEGLDLSKMYALGFSNGAGMVNLLGKRTSHFKAIAPLFSQQIISIGDLTPQTPLSVFQLGGELDELIPLNGGTSPVGEFMSEEASALDWVNRFDCETEPVEETLNWGGTTINSYQYLVCNNRNVVHRLVALNTGHGLQDVANIIAYEEVWNFFKRY